jgi:hypothetical protein
MDNSTQYARTVTLAGLLAASVAVSGAALIATSASRTAVAQTPTAPTPATQAPVVYFINLKDGDTVSSPFKVQFGLTGLGVAPAGMDKEKTGHHHLLIDTTLSAEEQKAAVPVDAKHMHFGGGQTEAMVTLPAGQHTLQLVFANWSHIPFDPPVQSAVIKVTVK